VSNRRGTGGRLGLAIALSALSLSSCTAPTTAPIRTAAPSSTTDATARSAVTDPVGSWTGHVEHGSFGAGNGTLLLTLTRARGQLSGVIVFDDRSRYPDPMSTANGTTHPSLIDGYRYRLHDVRMQGDRLRFHLETGDAFPAWCVAQRPRPELPYTRGWGCPELDTSAGPDGCFLHVRERFGIQPIPFDCKRTHWCLALRTRCLCAESTCEARPGESVWIDVTLSEDRGDGSMGFGLPRGGANLRLRRVHP
jgi:hypothetical protein